MLFSGLGACGAPASQPQCRACDVEVLTRRAPFLVVQGGRLQLVSSAQPPPARRGCIGGGRRPRHSPRGARSPRGAGRCRQARPLVPRGTLGGRPARRCVVEGARYGGPDPEGLHPATPYRRRPQGRDVCPHIVGARGARSRDKTALPRGLPCSSHSQTLNPPPATAAFRQLAWGGEGVPRELGRRAIRARSRVRTHVCLRAPVRVCVRPCAVRVCVRACIRACVSVHVLCVRRALSRGSSVLDLKRRHARS